MQGESADFGKPVSNDDKPPPPRPFKKPPNPPALVCFDPLEVARQLVLLDFPFFKAIQPHELLNTAWTSKNKETAAPNVIAMINRFNHVSYWAITEILRQPNLKDRARTIKRLIAIAEVLLALFFFFPSSARSKL